MQASVALGYDRRAWDSIVQACRVFGYLDTFSIVAPGVAVTWQLLIARAFQVQLPLLEPLVLILAVWSLYAADHLFDALRPRLLAWEPDRKTFYRLHWGAMAAIVTCTSAGAFGLALWSLTAAILHGGIALGLIVFLYFVLVHSHPFSRRALWPREVIVAIVFSAGIFLPVALSGRVPAASFITTAVLFFLLCWLNCCAVETWECRRSGCLNVPHRSTLWVTRHFARFTAFLFVAFLMLHSGGVPEGGELGGAGVASAAGLFVLSRLQSSLPLSLLSVATDLALCTPALVLTFTAS